MSRDAIVNQYYENYEFWKRDFNKIEEEKIRIDEVIKMVPSDVKTILEVGCGNGAIINNLANKPYFSRVVGIDISNVALSYVTTEKYLESTSKLHFEDNEFDIVIASEVIEHLNSVEYQLSLNEMKRVAKNYILISVPNGENLEDSLRYCTKCSCWFNPHLHMRSFDTDNFKDIFPSLNLMQLKQIGHEHMQRHYKYKSILWFGYGTRKNPQLGICPQCGFNYFDSNEGFAQHDSEVEEKITTDKHFTARLIESFKNKIYQLVIPDIPKKRWIIGIFNNE